MKRNDLLLFGLLATVVFAIGIMVLPAMIPGYSAVRQTVSEIGEAGSPARVPFTLLLCTVAACVLVFAWGLHQASVRAGHSAISAYLSMCLAVSATGVGVFSYPHPLHNLFGLSELIGYQAPLAFAWTWRRDAAAKGTVVFSGVMAAVVWAMIALNLASFDRSGLIWTHLKPIYGLVQRALFASWFVWSAGVGALLWRRG